MSTQLLVLQKNLIDKLICAFNKKNL